MSRYIDADKIDWRLIIPTHATIAEENMIYCAKRLIGRQPTADVIGTENLIKKIKQLEPLNNTDCPEWVYKVIEGEK